jgi:hypothetical protein
VLENLDIDDSDSPAIGLVPPGVTWQEVRDHMKIAHHAVLMPPSDGADDVSTDDMRAEYTGAYWSGTDMILIPDLGPDQEQAIDEFRTFLQEHDET